MASLPNIIRAQSAGADGSRPSGRLNVGFIGAGGISRGHMSHVLGDPKLQLLWICDVDRLALEEAHGNATRRYAEQSASGSYRGIKTTADFREVIADPDVDVIFNCVPDHWHALPLIYAAQAGKDIYSEKPLSRTPPEGRAMVAAVERSGIVCQIGSQQRSSREFQRAIALARNGALGKIRRVQVGLPGYGGVSEKISPAGQAVPPTLDYERWVGPAPFLPYVKERLHWNWRWHYAFAGGQLTDWINHHFDVAQLAHGVSDEVPVAIRGASAEFHQNPIYNTAIRFAFEAHYAGGQVIEVSSANRLGVRIEGDDGWVFVDRGTIEHSSNSLRSIPLPAQGFAMDGGKTDHRANFFNCIKTRTTPRSPIQQAHNTAMAAHLANAALRSGHAELRWDNQAGRVIGAPDAEAFLTCNYRAPWALPA